MKRSDVIRHSYSQVGDVAYANLMTVEFGGYHLELGSTGKNQ